MPKESKKKHTLKKDEALPHIEGDFKLVSCDLSMRCPGFALLQYHSDTRSVSLIKKDVVDNSGSRNSKKPHGKILNEIGSKLSEFLAGNDISVAVRERAFARFNAETQTLNKVVGVSEMIVWHILTAKFQELAPLSIKKHITGSGTSTKEDVALSIDSYMPDHPAFETDDESDAVAAGIAWLIANGYIDCIPLEKYKESAKEDDAE